MCMKPETASLFVVLAFAVSLPALAHFGPRYVLPLVAAACLLFYGVSHASEVLG